MEYSRYKTFACKYRYTMVKAKLRYWKDGFFSIPYVTPSGTEKQVAFYHYGFKKKKLSRDDQIDLLPQPVSVQCSPKRANCSYSERRMWTVRKTRRCVESLSGKEAKRIKGKTRVGSAYDSNAPKNTRGLPKTAIVMPSTFTQTLLWRLYECQFCMKWYDSSSNSFRSRQAKMDPVLQSGKGSPNAQAPF